MAVETARDERSRRWLRVAPLAVGSIATIYLIKFAIHQHETYQQIAGSTFDFSGSIWRWFLAIGIFVVIGFGFGLATRDRVAFGRFDWARALALGAVPLFFALSLPILILNLPTETWVARFRLDFVAPLPSGALGVLVGVAISAGFRDRSADE